MQVKVYDTGLRDRPTKGTGGLEKGSAPTREARPEVRPGGLNRRTWVGGTGARRVGGRWELGPIFALQFNIGLES